jgi:hypothetical protein
LGWADHYGGYRAPRTFHEAVISRPDDKHSGHVGGAGTATFAAAPV